MGTTIFENHMLPLRLEVVDELPQTGRKRTLYLVKNKRSDDQSNIYDEYIWNVNRFELVGLRLSDLDNYYKKSEVDKMIEDLNQQIQDLYELIN